MTLNTVNELAKNEDLHELWLLTEVVDWWLGGREPGRSWQSLIGFLQCFSHPISVPSRVRKGQ